MRKELRSLPQWFAHKVTAMEEAKNIQIMQLDELMSWLSFEKNLMEGKEEKGIVLQAGVRKPSMEDASDDQEDLTESLTLLRKDLYKVLKKIKGKNKGSENYQTKPISV